VCRGVDADKADPDVDVDGDVGVGVGVDYKRLYLCLEAHTERKSRFGSGVGRSGWLRLVNRRRIWDVSVWLLGEYWGDLIDCCECGRVVG
jgi:hypothetical protein